MDAAPFAADRPDLVAHAVRYVVAALHPSLHPDAIFGDARDRAPARARQLACYLMSERLLVGQRETGRQFDRDRTTVLHAAQTMTALIERDGALSALVDRAETLVRELLDLFLTLDVDMRPRHG